MEKDIVTIEEVADYLRVSERTVYDWAQKGQIPCGKLGTSWRFKRSEIENWANQKLSDRMSIDIPEILPLSAYLSLERTLKLSCTSKTDILNTLIDVCIDLPGIRSRSELAQAVFRREELLSTGIGLSIAIPHVRLNSVTDLFIALAVNDRDINDYESLDGKPVRIVVLIIAGRNQHTKYIKVLSEISAVLKNELTREQLYNAETPQQIYDIVIERDRG